MGRPPREPRPPRPARPARPERERPARPPRPEAAAPEALRGVVDALPATQQVGGWVTAADGRILSRIRVTAYDADGESIGIGSAMRWRADLGGDCGFLLALRRPVNAEELMSGKVVLRARQGQGPEWPLVVWDRLAQPAEQPQRQLTREFFQFCRARGYTLGLIDVSKGWDLALEGPSVVSARSVGHGCSVGAYSGLFGPENGFMQRTRIGRFCSIANRFFIGPDEHPQDYLTSSMVGYVPNVHEWEDQLAAMGAPRQAPVVGFDQRGETHIGHDVWIGGNVFIRQGVRIGNGAIIGAGAVVVKDVEPYMLMAGVPARPVRQRFPDAMVERLLRLRWWNYHVLGVPDLRWDRIEDAVSLLEDEAAAGRLAPLPVRPTTLATLHDAWLAEEAAKRG